MNKILLCHTHFISVVMRYSSLLFLSLAFSLTTFSFTRADAQYLTDTKIELNARNKPLATVLELIEEKSRFHFVYNTGNIPNPVISIKLASDLGTILREIGRQTHTRYEQVGDNIVVTYTPPQEPGKITGKITDTEGTPLAGANIRILELSREFMADEQGNMDITVPPGTYTLQITYVSYIPQRKENVRVSGGASIAVNIVLSPATDELSEVVVTALGIKRAEKSLGYAAQTVGEESVTDAKSNNWTSALSGKVAGLTIQGAGTGPMGSTRITLRGESSLNLDNNQALIVVDGVPVSNRITGTGFNSYLSQDSPVDFGTNVTDINPDDIESVTVLKGPAATALYGSRAASGALIITTKSAAGKKGLGISVNSNISFDQVNRWPDLQFEYGEGRTSEYYSYGASEDGPNTGTTVAAGRAWGPKFEGQLYYQYDPNTPNGLPTSRTPWVAKKDYISGFFQTGLTASNSLSLEGGSETGGSRLSVTHLTNKWIVPNTGFERINAAFSTQQQVSAPFKVNARVNYAYKQSDNLPAVGYNNQTLMYFLILGTTPNISPAWFKPYWEAGQEHIAQRKPFNSGPDNPYAIMYEMLNPMDKHNMIGNLSATYAINDRLELMVRSGLDFAAENRSQQRPYSMTKYPNGMYREQQVVNYESNTDFLFTYTQPTGRDFQFSLSAGGNYMFQSYRFKGMNADRLAQPGIYQLANSMDPVVSEPDSYEKAIASLYTFWRGSYREQLFLDVTGRNDWSSTLPQGARSFFYPSANLGWLVSETFALPPSVSFAKLRLSWAQVGNDTGPYQTARYYNQIYGNGLTNSKVLFNNSLKPEITSSFEVGMDSRFLNSRIGLDLTFYTNNSRNQILATPVDPVTGFTSALINAGLINSRGVEAVLTTKPVSNSRFQWTSTINWSLNRSYVRELADGIPSQIIYNNADLLTIEARVGGRMGDMYGLGFRRSPDGQVLYNDQGLPESLDPELKKWGNAFPDWKGGWQNQFSYRSVSLSILLDGQKGGHIYSHSNHKYNTLGKTKVTLPGRDDGVIGDGVVLQPDGSYQKNTVAVRASTFYENYYQLANVETNIFDASFLKIREVRLAYQFPTTWLSRIRVKSANFAIWGRDLFNFTNFPAYDPETGNLNNGTLTPGVEIAQFPSSRTFGANLSFKF